MTAMFHFDPLVITLVALAMFGSIVLAARFGGRRRVALIALQPLAAALLLAALSLRDAPAPSTLIVLTPNAQVAGIDAGLRATRIALPGGPAGEGIESVPDLATALRRYAADRLIVAGDGLPRHDRDTVGARALEFIPSPPSKQSAFIEFDAPATVRAGTWWTLRGRVANAQDARIELLDPAGSKIATAAPADDGRFVLEALARAPGPAVFELQLRRGDTTLRALPVPVVAETAAPLRVLLLAASPSPELKYLRRWALDAGAQLEARIALAPGLGQRRGTATLDAAQLAELDLLIVDERSWPQLAALQPALREAVTQGLGLLVRITGPVPERVAQAWKAWGIDATSATKTREVRLPEAPQVLLHAWPGAATQTQPVLSAAIDGAPLAQWHALGRGRVGTWRLADSHRLYTRGDRERHATLWSQAWSTLARPRAAAPRLPMRAVSGERAVICGVAPDAAIATPAGTSEPLAVVDDCAAFWPRSAGWHRLTSGGSTQPFHVHDPALLASILSEERREATRALVRAMPAPKETAPRSTDALRAALLAALALVMTLAWWIERRALVR